MGFFSKNGFELEGVLTSCTFDYLSRDIISRALLLSLFFGGFILPFLIIVVFYLLLLSLLKYKNQMLKFHFDKTKKQPNKRLSKLSIFNHNLNADIHMINNNTNADSNISLNLIENNKFKSLDSVFFNESLTRLQKNSALFFKNYLKKKNYLIKREIKVAKTILICVGFFCLSWFPYAIMVLVAQFGNDIENYITPLSASLPALFAKTSTIINPIVYTLTNKNCQLFLLELFRIKHEKYFVVHLKG